MNKRKKYFNRGVLIIIFTNFQQDNVFMEKNKVTSNLSISNLEKWHLNFQQDIIILIQFNTWLRCFPSQQLQYLSFQRIYWLAHLIYLYRQQIYDAERVTFFNGNIVPKLNAPSGYSIPIVWQKAQTKIANSSYYLMGWKISTAHKWLSYDASLNSITLTGANIYFNPSTFSEVMQISFGITLLTSQSGLIRLIYYEHNNSSLAINVNREVIPVPIGAIFRADIASYKVSSFLSSFTVTYAGGATKQLSVNIDCLPIVAGSNYQLFESRGNSKIIPKIAFTYFMLDLMSYPFTPFVYTGGYQSWGSVHYITVPLLYESRTSQNCIVGILGISSYGLVGFHHITMTPSNSTDLTRLYEFSAAGIWGWVAKIVCTKKNPVCQYDCQICSDNIACLKCLWGWPVTGGCTTIIGCIQVNPNSTTIIKCTKYKAPKVLAFGLCVNTYGCNSVNYVSNSSGLYSFCVSCYTTLGFSPTPINQTCICMPYSTFNKTAKDRCIPCPTNCVLCDELNGKTNCLNCTQQYNPNYPLNTSCLLIPPNCTSVIQIITQLSCTSCKNKFFLTISPTSIYLKVCSPCLVDCLTCNSANQCLSCLNGGFPIKGGCSKEKHCIQVRADDSSLQKCIRCSSQYYLATGLCTNISGCITAYWFEDQVICLVCNIKLDFLFVPQQNVCVCKRGFHYDSILKSCQQICGDSLLLNHFCDDGNTENNDGCSSQCNVENDFACVNDGTNSPSRCVYLQFNIKLKVKSITKKFMENRATFTFTIVPFLSVYRHMKQSDSYSLTSKRAMSNLSFNVQTNQIAIEVQFTEDLQAFEATLQIQLPKDHFLQRKAQLSFSMVSNDTKLIIIKQRQKMILFSQIEDICSVVNLCLFLLGSVIHRMIGLQTLLPLQITYLTHLLNEQRTPSYGIFGFLANSAFNFKHKQNRRANIRSDNPFTFSSQNEEATAIIILFISIIVSILLIFSLIVTKKSSQSKDKKQALKRNQKKQMGTKIKEILFMLCKNIIFSLSLGIFCVFWPLYVSHITINKEYFNFFVKGITFTVVLLIFVTSAQCKYFFIRRQQLSQYIYKPSQRYERKYVPLFFTFLLAISIVLCFGFTELIPAEALLLLTLIVYELILIVYRPYRNGFHNFTIIFNNSIPVCFLAWNLARNYDESLRDEQNELLAILSIILLIIISLIISITRIIIQLKVLVKQFIKGQKQNSDRSKPEAIEDARFTDSIKIANKRPQLLSYPQKYYRKYDLEAQRQDFANISHNYFKKTTHIKKSTYKFLENLLKSKRFKPQGQQN